METYVPRETPAEAFRDRSRWVLLPVAVGAWIAGGLLLLVAASGLVTVVLGATSHVASGVVLHTLTTLPANTDSAAPGQVSVADGTSPTMTQVTVSVTGLPAAAAFVLRLAPVLTAGTLGATAVLTGIVVTRIGRRSVASRLLLVTTIVLVGGSAVAQVVAASAALAARSVAWTGIPQIQEISATWSAAFDPAPFVVGAGLLVVVHLLRRLEGAGVLVAKP